MLSRSWMVVALGPLLMACGAHRTGPGASHAERLSPATNEVSEDQFAQAVHDLLVTEPKTPERATRLQGVEARQMARAVDKFKQRDAEQGLNAVRGGLYLIRTGELDASTLGPQGPDALRFAAKELASRGDEGRSRAMYDILVRLVPEPERTDVRGHLDALAQWARSSSSTSGPLESSGGAEKVTVRRRLLEPSVEALQEAEGATDEWINRAVDLLNRMQKGPRVALPREEAIEAHRALGSGGAALAALHLRDGDAQGAIAAIEKADAREMIPAELMHAIEAAADSPDPVHWLGVLKALRPLAGHGQLMSDEEQDDFAEDRELYRAAAFGVAEEAYRLDPTVPESAAVVAAALEDLSMAEASPTVLVDAAKAHPTERTVGAALAITLHAIQTELQLGDVEGARRTFHAATPVLAAGDARNLAGKVHPSSALVRGFMGEVELNEGRIDEARALLKASAAGERSGRVLLTLAKVEQHDGQAALAIDHLRDGLAADDTAKDPALRGEILLMISDIMRENGAVAAARTPLTDALRELVQSSQNVRHPGERARVERTLARVLDRFGQDKPAERALERSIEAAGQDKNQISLSVGQMVGRAFVRGDLPAARDGLARAMAADLDSDDLVYLALWVRLLERQLHQPTDGAADRVFAALLPAEGKPDDGKWETKLAEFGAGKIKGDALIGLAKTPSQRTEATFYEAMDRAAQGDRSGEMEALKRVIGAATVQLMEVSFARDILAGPNAKVGDMPTDVALP